MKNPVTTPKELDALAERLSDATIGEYYKRVYHPDRFTDAETAIKKILTRELAELMKDRERLEYVKEWMMKHSTCLPFYHAVAENLPVWCHGNTAYKTFTEAIDAAMKGNTK